MKYLQNNLHSKLDKYKIKTPLIKLAVIALKDRVDLISIIVPLAVIVKNYKHDIYKCFWIKHNLVRPNHVGRK